MSSVGIPAEVLVVDDDPIGSDVLATIFRKLDCSVSVAGTGGECLRLLADERPELILLDVVLPDIPGTDLCAQIRDDPAHEGVLIVLMSGLRVSSEDHVLGLEVGADDYVERPFSADEIVARVRALSRLKESTRRRYHHEPDTLSSAARTSESARIFGQGRLRETYPEVFASARDRYVETLGSAIEARLQDTDRSSSTAIEELARSLGNARASARDLIDLHTNALEHLSPGSSARRALYVREEGRLVLVELMGHVVNYYRQRT